MERTGTMVGQQESVDPSLQSTMRAFNDAFNRFDAEQVASFWAEEGTLINPIGNFGQGRAGVERVFREDAQQVLGGTTSTFSVTRARSVGDRCLFLDVDCDVQNARRPDGSRGPMKMHVVVLAERQGGGWKWLDVRPYGFMQRPPSLH